MIKAVFFDIDGTLLCFKTHKVSNKSLKALHILKNKGIKVFIATGRHKSEINHFNGFNFDGYVTLNGQYCFNSKQIIYKKHLAHKDISTLVSLLKNQPISCIFLEEDSVYLNKINEDVKKMLKIIKINNLSLASPENALNKDIYQVIAFVSLEDERNLLKKLSESESTRWHPLFIDIVPKNGSKEIGIKEVLKYHNIQSNEIMCIGDGENDISMLKLAKISIAMGNASDIVKKHADYITSNVEDEGVYNALKYFNLI